MGEIKLGFVHVDFEYRPKGPYAYISSRMRWKFWRWEIIALYTEDVNEEVLVGTNLTKLGAIGMLKLLGVTK